MVLKVSRISSGAFCTSTKPLGTGKVMTVASPIVTEMFAGCDAAGACALALVAHVIENIKAAQIERRIDRRDMTPPFAGLQPRRRALKYPLRTAMTNIDPISLLAQAAPAIDSSDAPSAWLPVVLLIIMGIGFAVSNIVASLLLGPSRTGAAKAQTYESGMVPIGDARKRFNVRFYIVAMIFLVFDVEIVFFYPWASIFSGVVRTAPQQSTWLLWEMVVFVALLLVAYIYAWGKGVFRWD
jgi:NADH-quinone oxidoreductase subunit A